jgi:tetratricopeptide (TPR) repeat protein
MRSGTVVATILLALGLVALRGAQAPPKVSAPADAVRLNNLGVAAMNQQKFEVALGHFEQARARDASFGVARVNQAIALLALQRYDAAKAALDAALKEDPANARAWYNLGLLEKSLGNAEASLAAFKKATELQPADAYAHYFAGLLASQLQQYDFAIAQFRRALELDPFLVSAEFGLARAHQRAGHADQAKAHMDRFTRLTQEKVASAMSLAYGDQGPLSLAQSVQPAASAARPAVPVTFVADAAGLEHPSAGPQSANAGPGGCFVDFDGDGLVDFVRVGPGVELMRNTGKGRFAPHAQLTPDPGATSCTVGDFDNDEHADLAVGSAETVALFRGDGKSFSHFAPPTGPLPLDKGGNVAGVAFVDYDHDADLDLVVTRSGQGAGATLGLLRNNGNGTFANVTAERGVGLTNTVAAIATDLNNDRAIDLVVTGDTARILINPREGSFKGLDQWTPDRPANTRGVVVLDFDKDGWMDLAFTHGAAPGVSLWRNAAGARFERVDLPASSITSGFGLNAVDYDNDGWTDLAAAGNAASGGVVQVLRNVQGRFEDASGAVGASAIHPKRPHALLSADIDADGDTDLVITDAAAPPIVLRNDGGSANRSIRIALRGLNDNRSGIGTKVEVQAGSIWQKFETAATSGFLGANSPELVVGIGDASEVDVVRLLWPTGVVQDEVQLAAGRRHEIVQIDRRGSSCPILFSWNGERYEFIADAIGPAVVGHWVAPGQRNIPDADEFVKVDGRQVQVRDGRISLKFAEPMEEVIYLDQVKLFAIDHPAGTEVHPNEYFAALPPHPADRVFASRDRRLPLGAWDEQGRDVMPALRARDRRFVDTFASDGFKGFAKLHALELDLGETVAGPLRLLMHGFTDYFTATSVFAAHQANVAAIVPYVEAQLPDGTWKRVADDIGFPAGLLRTMTADLSGRLPAGTRRIRIWTNLKVYWDQVVIDTTPVGSVAVARTEIPLAEATLAHRGFPRELAGTPVSDLRYVYDEVSAFGPYARHRGFYTRYGEVTPLVRQAEDRFVIFGAGDEVSLEFDAAALPPLPEGWTRDFFVYLNGFVKDMDFYAAHAQTVAPLPFKGMPGYPYPAGIQYPDRHREYQFEWNTREVSGEAWPSYRFSFGGK